MPIQTNGINVASGSVEFGGNSGPALTISAHAGTVGFLECNTGIHTNSSIWVDSGSLTIGQDEAYIALQDGGIQMFIQAGPRGKEAVITGVAISSNVLTVTFTAGPTSNFVTNDVVYISGTKESFLNGQKVTVTGATTTTFTANFTHANFTNASDTGEATTGNVLATSVLNLPDLTGGTSSPNSGFLTGITNTEATSGAGNAPFIDGATGLLHDSHIGMNSNITIPNYTNGIAWTKNTNSGFLFSSSLTAARNWTLPDAGGNVVIDSAIQTLSSKTLSAPVLLGSAPTVSSGQVGLGGGTATSATAGSNGAVPAQVAGYLVINIGGTNAKVPYFNN